MGKRRVRVDVWQYLDYHTTDEETGETLHTTEHCLEATRTFEWGWQAKEWLAKYPPLVYDFVVTKG